MALYFNTSFPFLGQVLAQPAPGGDKSLSLEVFKNCGDVALRDMAGGHGEVGWSWTWGF